MMDRKEVAIAALKGLVVDCEYSLAIHKETGNYFNTEEELRKCCLEYNMAQLLISQIESGEISL